MNYVCVDFDGTCVTHSFPDIGEDIGAAPVLKRLVEKGHKLILFTMRSNMLSPLTLDDSSITPDYDGNYLNQAIQWFNKNGIPLWGIQTNPTQKQWTESPKAYGHLYIDDAALGCPLIHPSVGRPYADWNKIEKILEETGWI